jgi:Zn-dependent protease
VILGPGAFAPILGFAAVFAAFGAQAGMSSLAAATLGGIGGTASLLVHEFGHVRVARRVAGIRSARVSLLWLGAATRLEGAYVKGSEQARVAIAGPRASLEFAGALAALVLLLPMPPPLEQTVLLLAALNVAIAALNLVPASPMDGHKLVVGLLWSATGSQQSAQQAIRRLGRAAQAVFPAAMAILLAVEPSLGLGAAAMAGTLFAQQQLMRNP